MKGRERNKMIKTTFLKVYPDLNIVFQNTVSVVLGEILIYVPKHVLKTTTPHTDRQKKHKINTPSIIQIKFCDKITIEKFLTARFEVATTVLMTIQVFGMSYHVD
jgi:hypothetical protein